MLDGQRIFVRANHQQQQQPAAAFSATSSSSHQVFVGNLPFETTWQQLKDFVRDNCTGGGVDRVEIMETPQGRSKGWGLVSFAHARDAAEAVRLLHGRDFQGRTLQVREDRKGGGSDSYLGGGDREPSKKVGGDCQVFVRNLSYETRWQDLKDLFRQCGSVDRAEIMETAEGKSKGHGLISFFNASDAARAVEQLDGVELGGRALEVRMNRGKPSHRDDESMPQRGGRRSGPERSKPDHETEEEIYDRQEALESALKSGR